MNTADLETILTSPERTDTVALLLSDSAKDADVLAAHSLKEKFGERAFIINSPKQLDERWQFLFKNHEQVKKEVVISLDLQKSPIEELRYEKTEGKLKIYLTPEHPVRKDDFSFEETYPACDILIAFGFSDDTELTEKLREVPVRTPNGVFRVGASAGQATLGQYQPHIATPEKATAKSSVTEQPTPRPQQRVWAANTMKLWARAFLRSYVEEDLNVFWAFLPKEDFVKTGQSYEILPTLLEDMKQFSTLPPVSIILWEEEGSQNQRVKALIHSEDTTRLARIASAFNTTLSGSGTYCITAGYPNFSEAEIEIRKLLKKVL
jgi:hypothetical protein